MTTRTKRGSPLITVTAIAALILIALIAAAGCAKKEAPAEFKSTTYRKEDFADKTFAILSGSSFDAAARDIIGVTQCKYYDTPAKAIEAVLSGEADATLMEEPVARKFAAQYSDKLIVLAPPVDIENYATIFPKADDGALRGEFNAFLTKLRADGVYNDMVKRWVDTPESPPMPDIELNPTKRVLVFLTSDCDPPFSFKTDADKLEGFDVEMALRFAQAGGYGLDVRVTEFPDIIPAIRAGQADFASNLITITEERKAFIDFSDPVYYGGTVVITRK